MSPPIDAASRRQFIGSAATALAGLSFAGAAAQAQAPAAATPQTVPLQKILPANGQFPVKVISSHNGLMATKLAYKVLLRGGEMLDALVAGATLVENDPNDMTVGYGGLPNEEGVVELDASIMHGPTHRAGAVASLRNIKNPAAVARLVMEQTDHILIVGEGALRFARAHGFPEENLLTERARKIWLYWRQTHGPDDDWFPPPDEQVDPEVLRFFNRPTGTIHLAGMSADGDISCLTSTSGLAFKIPGRVGDSPIIGAGIYVDNAIGSCGSTGRGEANLGNLSSHAAVELMRQGLSPVEAGLEVLRRIASHTPPRLLDAKGLPTFNLQFYIIAKDGTHAGVSFFGPKNFAITDAAGTRHEKAVTLYDEPRPEDDL